MNGEKERLKPHAIVENKGYGLYIVECGACGCESQHHVDLSNCCPKCGQVFCMAELADTYLRKKAIGEGGENSG